MSPRRVVYAGAVAFAGVIVAVWPLTGPPGEGLVLAERLGAPWPVVVPSLPFVTLVLLQAVSGAPRPARAAVLAGVLALGLWGLTRAGSVLAVAPPGELRLLPTLLLVVVHVGALALVTWWGLCGLRTAPAVDAPAAGPADRSSP